MFVIWVLFSLVFKLYINADFQYSQYSVFGQYGQVNLTKCLDDAKYNVSFFL